MTRNDLNRHILRVGIPIMLLQKSPKLCNGTRLKVKALYGNIVETTILTQGETVFVPRTLLITNDRPFKFKRLHFLFKVCLAMTIKWSQRQTLKFAVHNTIQYILRD